MESDNVNGIESEHYQWCHWIIWDLHVCRAKASISREPVVALVELCDAAKIMCSPFPSIATSIRCLIVMWSLATEIFPILSEEHW